MVSSDYYYWDARLTQPGQAFLEDIEGPDPWSHVVEDITSMYNGIGPQLDYSIYDLVETLIDFLLYQVSSIFVNAAEAGEAKVRVRHMNYLQVLSFNLKPV